MIIVSPGIYGVERSYAAYAPAISTSVLAIVSSASKGPVNTPTMITDINSLISTFGTPSINHYGVLAAVEYLKRGRQCLFIRVATYDVTADNVIRNEADSADACAVEATSSGSWGNSISVVVGAGRDANTYKITVKYGGYTVETFDLLRVGTANVEHQNYWATRINGVSNYIILTDIDDTQTTLKTSTTAIQLEDGEDGAPTDVSDVVGVAGSPPAVPTTGMQHLRNTERWQINMMAVPGRTDAAIVAELLSIAEERADCLAIIDPPYGYSVQQVVDWHNGSFEGMTLDSSYAALYWPWLQVYDAYSQSNIWVPPSGHVAAAMAYTDYVADPWYAPAGQSRGQLFNIIELEHSPTQGERDYMYANGNAVNPIVAFLRQSPMIWGQRTLHRQADPTDRIHVRRMLNYLKTRVLAGAKVCIFEPNDETTWAVFRQVAESVCAEIAGRRGLDAYQVICDETTNPETLRERNEMHANILIAPTHCAEMISVEFSIVASAASFNEFVVGSTV